MSAVTITRAELLPDRLNACEEGLALFDAIAAMQCDPERLVIPEWTRLHGVWAWATCHAFVSWCENLGVVPRADLRGADLSYACLSYADLYGADLSGADFRGADLRGANLRGADLRGADLSYACLSYADLYGADLSGADFRGADLSGADFRGADLRGADFRGAYRGTSPAPDGWRAVNGYLERAA